jgi:peptide/nickel transport system ATP-binding protein/oligopeptide transport system ATP-binding protein
MRSIRGAEIAMIFQEPMTSLNPVFTIGDQIVEAILLHGDAGKRQAQELAIQILEEVGIPLPRQRFNEYPHQLSGGMRQRAMIAMALSCNPSLLIADEPTTALDVTIQAQVLELMHGLRQQFNGAIMFITHDLGVIAGMADDIIVMYCGKIVESGPVLEIFKTPLHPYTIGLMRSIPSLIDSGRRRLDTIEGVVPTTFSPIAGCAFAPRCSEVMEICRQKAPACLEVAPGHRTACFLHHATAEGT